MTQEQFNFLERFGAYLTRRGFQVSKSLYEAEAIADAELFGTLSVVCRFAWKWQGAYSSVLLQIQIGTLMFERSLPTGLLMDYEVGGTEIITIMMRNLMQEVADKIALQLIQE